MASGEPTVRAKLEDGSLLPEDAGKQRVLVLCADAGRAVAPSKALLSMKKADVQTSLNILHKNGFTESDGTRELLVQRTVDESISAGEFAKWVQSWFPKRTDTKFSYPTTQQQGQ